MCKQTYLPPPLRDCNKDATKKNPLGIHNSTLDPTSLLPSSNLLPSPQNKYQNSGPHFSNGKTSGGEEAVDGNDDDGRVV